MICQLSEDGDPKEVGEKNQGSTGTNSNKLHFSRKRELNCVKCHRNYEDENWENGVGKKQIIRYFQEHISKRAASLNLEYAQE